MEEQDEAIPQNPLYVILQSFGGEEFKTTVSKSVFEAKGGVRAAVLDQKADQDSIERLKKNSYTKKSMKNLQGHMTKTGQNYNHIVLREVPKARKLTAILKTGFDA